VYIVEQIKKMYQFYGRVGLTIGNFEGFHRGHREIVRTLLSRSLSCGLKTAVITFKEHPLKLLYGMEPERLTLPNEKLVYLRNAGVDLLLYLDFSAELADTEPEDFLLMVQRKLSPGLLCLGKGFRFGKDNRGDIEFLRDGGKGLNYDLLVVDDVVYRGGPVSSTRIRDAVKRGDFELAGALLGRDYHLYVTAHSGAHLLRPLCANCAFPDDGRYRGVLIGTESGENSKIVVERIEEGFSFSEDLDLRGEAFFRLQFSHRLGS
jgi:riboflavin kinase/FMN adenylyltransferase